MEQLRLVRRSSPPNPPVVPQKKKSEHHDEIIKLRVSRSQREGSRRDAETKGNSPKHRPASTGGVKTRKCGSNPVPSRQFTKQQLGGSRCHLIGCNIPSLNKTISIDKKLSYVPLPKNTTQQAHIVQTLKPAKNTSPPSRKESTSEKSTTSNSHTNRRERHKSAPCTQTIRHVQEQGNTQCPKYDHKVFKAMTRTCHAEHLHSPACVSAHQHQHTKTCRNKHSPNRGKPADESSRVCQKHRSACSEMLCSSRKAIPVHQKERADVRSVPAADETTSHECRQWKAGKKPDHLTCSAKDTSNTSSRVSSSDSFRCPKCHDRHSRRCASGETNRTGSQVGSSESFRCPKHPERHVSSDQKPDTGRSLENHSSRGDETLHVANIPRLELYIPTKESRRLEVNRCAEGIGAQILRTKTKLRQQGHSSRGISPSHRKKSQAVCPKEPVPPHKTDSTAASESQDSDTTPSRYKNYLKHKFGFESPKSKFCKDKVLKNNPQNVTSTDQSHIPAHNKETEESTKIETEESKTNDLNKQESPSKASEAFGDVRENSVNLPVNATEKDDMGAVERHQSSQELSEAKERPESANTGMEESKANDRSKQECAPKASELSVGVTENAVSLPESGAENDGMGTVENRQSSRELSEAKGTPESGKIGVEEGQTDDQNKEECPSKKASEIPGAVTENTVSLPVSATEKEGMGMVENHQSNQELSEAKGTTPESGKTEKSKKKNDIDTVENHQELLEAKGKTPESGETKESKDKNDIGTMENHQSKNKFSEAEGAASESSETGTEENKTHDLSKQECLAKVSDAPAENPVRANNKDAMGTVENHQSNQELSKAIGAASEKGEMGQVKSTTTGQNMQECPPMVANASAEQAVSLLVKSTDMDDTGSVENYRGNQELSEAEGAASKSGETETEESKTHNLSEQECPSAAPASDSAQKPEAEGAAPQSGETGVEEDKTYELNEQEFLSTAADPKTSPVNETHENIVGRGEIDCSSQEVSETASSAEYVTEPLHGDRSGSLDGTQTEQSGADSDYPSGPKQQTVPKLTPVENPPAIEATKKNAKRIITTTTSPPCPVAQIVLPDCITNDDSDLALVENGQNREKPEPAHQVGTKNEWVFGHKTSENPIPSTDERAAQVMLSTVTLSNFYLKLQDWKKELLTMHGALDSSPSDAAHGSCPLCHKESDSAAPQNTLSRHLVQELRGVIPQCKQCLLSENHACHCEKVACKHCVGNEGKEPCDEPLQMHISHCAECRELTIMPLQQSLHMVTDDLDLLLDTLKIFHPPGSPQTEEVCQDNDNGRSTEIPEITSQEDCPVSQDASSVQSEPEVKRDVLNFGSGSKLSETEEKSLTSMPYFKPVGSSSQSLENSQHLLNRRVCSETASILKDQQVTDEVKQDHFNKTMSYFSDSCLANCYIVHKKVLGELKVKHLETMNSQEELDQTNNKKQSGQKLTTAATQLPYSVPWPVPEKIKRLKENAKNGNNAQHVNTEKCKATRAKHTSYKRTKSVCPSILPNPELLFLAERRVPILSPTVRQSKQAREKQLKSASDQMDNRRERVLGKFLLRYLTHLESRIAAAQSEEESQFYEDTSDLLPKGDVTRNATETPVTIHSTIHPQVSRLAQASQGVRKQLEELLKPENELSRFSQFGPCLPLLYSYNLVNNLSNRRRDDPKGNLPEHTHVMHEAALQLQNPNGTKYFHTDPQVIDINKKLIYKRGMQYARYRLLKPEDRVNSSSVAQNVPDEFVTADCNKTKDGENKPPHPAPRMSVPQRHSQNTFSTDTDKGPTHPVPRSRCSLELSPANRPYFPESRTGPESRDPTPHPLETRELCTSSGVSVTGKEGEKRRSKDGEVQEAFNTLGQTLQHLALIVETTRPLLLKQQQANV